MSWKFAPPAKPSRRQTVLLVADVLDGLANDVGHHLDRHRIGAAGLATALSGLLPDIGNIIKGFTWVVILVTTIGVGLSFTPIRKLEGGSSLDVTVSERSLMPAITLGRDDMAALVAFLGILRAEASGAM